MTDQVIEKPTVLVVDDEPMITTILAAILRRAGYPVLTASRAREALEICRESPSPIALAIIDYLMPDQHGLELAAGLKELQPDMRIVMMSGYTGLETMNGVRSQLHGFLQKPFKVESAVRAVQQALDLPIAGNNEAVSQRSAERYSLTATPPVN